MKPFLYLSARTSDEATAAERASMLEHTGLRADALVHHRLDRAPLPEIDLTELSGVLLGGSPYDWSAPPERKDPLQRRVEHDVFALVRRILDADFPFFGACYGMGAVATVLETPLGPDFAEDAGAVTLQVTSAGRSDRLLDDAPAQISSFVGHHESLLEVPEGAELLLTSATAPVQMIRVGERGYATQFHPELDRSAFIRRATLYDGHGYYPAGHIAAIEQATLGLDTTPAHRLLRRFALEHGRR